MKLSATKLLQIFFLFVLTLTSCEETTEIPVTEKIKRVYNVETVRHDNVAVYSAGASNNLFQGYKSFQLNLTNPSQATLTEVTSETFRGTYRLNGSNLILENLNPSPTGSNGSIFYKIISINANGSELILETAKANPKTGNTVNVYVLRSMN